MRPSMCPTKNKKAQSLSQLSYLVPCGLELSNLLIDFQRIQEFMVASKLKL